MTDQLEALRDSIVAAVQQELTRHGQQVKASVEHLQTEIANERTARSQLEDRLGALASALERSQQANTGYQAELQRALEERLAEFGADSKKRHEDMDARIGRVVEQANTGIAGAVENATKPIMKELEHRQDKVEANVSTLDGNLRRFDDQAARMVTHFNNVTAEIDGRMEEVSSRVSSNIDERLAALVARVDEVAALASRQETEVTTLITSRVDQTEDRINDRIMTTEARLNDEIGTRVAEIDAHLGRVTAGLDDTVTMLNDRITGADAKFAEVEAQIAAMEESVKSVDAEAMEEMAEKVSAAAGEAVLVRIELERFQKDVGEQMDKEKVRVTELETMIQEQHMDVETAVQLERLEEVERAVMALDPTMFDRTEAHNVSTNGADAPGEDVRDVAVESIDVADAAPEAIDEPAVTVDPEPEVAEEAPEADDADVRAETDITPVVPTVPAGPAPDAPAPTAPLAPPPSTAPDGAPDSPMGVGPS